ncbi:MAG: DUF350 domain-containing protein [Gammaproteobacteria bacterium]|nr:DUF350 domain-containing protein [Gammaproteobacteria bacterium]
MARIKGPGGGDQHRLNPTPFTPFPLLQGGGQGVVIQKDFSHLSKKNPPISQPTCCFPLLAGEGPGGGDPKGFFSSFQKESPQFQQPTRCFPLLAGEGPGGGDPKGFFSSFQKEPPNFTTYLLFPPPCRRGPGGGDPKGFFSSFQKEPPQFQQSATTPAKQLISTPPQVLAAAAGGCHYVNQFRFCCMEFGMTPGIDPILLNFLYAFLGGALTLFFMWMGCKIFNHTVCFNISDELKKGNTAVGQMIMGIFIGIGVAMGLVIGLGLN